MIHASWPYAPRHFTTNEEALEFVKSIGKPVCFTFPDAEKPEITKRFWLYPNGRMEEVA